MGQDRQGPTTDVQLGLLRDLTSRLLNAAEIDDVLRVIAECTMTVLRYEDCVVYLRTPDDFLLQRAAFGPKSPGGTAILDPIQLSMGEGIVGAAGLSGESVLVSDTLEDARYVVDDLARRSELAVPIVDSGEVIGVIDSEHSEPNFYTEADRKIVRDIASIAAARLRAAMITENLNQSVLDLEAARSALDNLSKTDDLTGLGNRRLFEVDLADAVASGMDFSVCILDLDKFKQVNDTHGHHEGDEVLRQFGEILAASVDTDRVTIARLGGDEFGILQVGVDLTSFDRMIEGLIASVQGTAWSANAALLDLSASAGVATGSNFAVWAHADEALLLAKAEGGDQMLRFVWSDPRSLALHEDRLWARRIRDAVKTDRFSLVGQPIVSAQNPDGPIQLMEVLLRYHGPDGSVLAPGRFLESAARFGLLEHIDGWVLRTAVKWLAANSDSVSLSVNVSPSSMLSGFAIREAVSELTALHVDPSRLILEVTEHAAIEDGELFKSALAAARGMGMRVAMDDLGSGWTSLAVIKENPVDMVKIDGNWVRQATTDKVAHTIVRSIIECGQLLGSQVVAEWVEDQETLDLVCSFDAEYVQGYLVGAPVPLEVVETSEAGVSRSVYS